MKLAFWLNGERVTLTVAPTRSLLDLVREDLGLTGTKSGCRSGECGACLVLLDSELVNACLVPAFRVQGRKVTTVEGLLKDRFAAEIKNSLETEGLLQCGFCESGVLMAVAYLLSSRSVPTEKEIREALSGNICRCTSHAGLVETVKIISSVRRTR